MARRPLSPVQLKLTIAPDVESLDRALEALDHLLENPEFIAQLLRQAVAETLLMAYRKRFLDNLEAVLTPELAKGTAARPKTPGGEKAKARLTEAYEVLAKATTPTEERVARKRVQALEAKLVEKLERQYGGSELSTGQFRVRALEVLRTLSDASLVTTETDSSEVRLGIGRLSALNAIETPSATPMLTGHPTSSALTTMWRQLEFGTGIYAKAPGVQAGKGWWYGPRPGMGFKVLGAHGVHAVFDAATGLPYTADGLKFEEVFAGMLGRALAGR